MQEVGRREFVVKLAAVTGGFALFPTLISCGGEEPGPLPKEEPSADDEPDVLGIPEIPNEKPEKWNPVQFNTDRGNAGAIPEFYRDDINGPDGVKKHLGKHLPYVPAIESSIVPSGSLALMWGDPERGYTRHPNAPKATEGYPNGHWYDWVKIRKATAGPAKEVESTFSAWPQTTGEDSGKYAPFAGDEITDDGGKNTVYLAALPSDVKAGDVVRVHAHCLYHGEYVDFVTVPAV